MATSKNHDDYLIAGTPNFMAPEMLIYASHTPETDIWALGVTLHWSISSKYPFEAPNKRELTDLLVSNKQEYSFPHLKHCASKELKDFIKKILQFNPKRRLTIQEAFKHDFITNVTQANENEDEDFLTNCFILLINNMIKFSELDIFRKYVFQYYAKIGTSEDNKKEKKFFEDIDRGFKGYIDFQDIIELCNKFKPGLTLEELEEFWIGLDFTKAGKIYYSEFKAASLFFLENLTDGIIKNTFTFFARDLKEYITIESFVESLLHLGIKVNEDALILYFNRLNNSKLNFEDFETNVEYNKKSLF